MITERQLADAINQRDGWHAEAKTMELAAHRSRCDLLDAQADLDLVRANLLDMRRDFAGIAGVVARLDAIIAFARVAR